MSDLPENLVLTAEEHLAHHESLHRAFNNLVVGPITINAANADAGVQIYTPAVGDRIIGLHVEVTQGWDAVDEQIGIGYASTTDADLALKFSAPPSVPTSRPTFSRGQGIGIPLGGEIVRVTSTAPIFAKTVVGGNTTGSCTLYLHVLSAALF